MLARVFRRFLKNICQKYLDRSANSLSEIQEDRRSHEEFLNQIYLELLGRQPDREGMDHFCEALNSGHSRSSIVLAVAQSDEFLSRMNRRRGLIKIADNLSNYQQPETLEGYHNSQEVLAKQTFEVAWQRLYKSNKDHYFVEHKWRYYELFNALAFYSKSIKTPSVLDIGPSIFLPLYKILFPDINLITVDRPLVNDGASAEYCIACGVSNHYYIDLNKERIDQDMRQSNLGKFDFICCTEVLEHLLVNPVEFFEQLLSLLNPNGIIYLTTPNFFSWHNREKMLNLENPQHVFPGYNANKDGHHHFREYSMEELVRFIGLAGGIIEFKYYSHCWDEPEKIKSLLHDHPDQKSNIVIIFTKAA